MSEKGAVWMKNGEKTRGWKFCVTTVTVGAGSKPALVFRFQTRPGGHACCHGRVRGRYENIYQPETIIVKHEPENMYDSGEFQIADETDKETIEVLAFERVVRDD